MKTSTKFLFQSLLQAKNSELKNVSPSKLISEFKNHQYSSFSFSFYLSNRDANSNLIDSELLNIHFNNIKNSIVNFFGGLSIHKVDGFYKNSNGVIIAENISIFTFHSFDSGLEFKKIKQILNLFFDYGVLTQQECLMLSFNNVTTLVYL